MRDHGLVPTASPRPPELSTSRDLALDDVRAALPGYVGNLGVDPQDVDDFVQETLARVLAVRHRLADDVVGSYACVIARNLVVSRRRSETIAKRKLPDLLDPTQDESGEAFVERREREVALLAALATLGEADRDVLVSHELHGESTSSIGRRHGKAPAAVAMQLARLRARVRLDYLLALRRAPLTSDRCGPVLLAVSAGDLRRQRETRSAEHLMTCAGCADLAAPLMERRLWLAVLWPFGLGALWAGMRRWGQQSTPARTVQAVGMTAVASVTVLALTHRAQPTPPAAATPRRSATTTAAPSPMATWAPGFVADAHVGRPVVLLRAPVQSVPADEGFWIGSADDRVWVQIKERRDSESPQHVRAGDTVSGLAHMVANAPSFLRDTGLDANGGAADLRRQGVHAEIDPSKLRVTH